MDLGAFLDSIAFPPQLVSAGQIFNRPLPDYPGQALCEGRLIGDGAFGYVFETKMMDRHGMVSVAAVKVARLPRNSSLRSTARAKSLQRFYREAAIWNSLQHPNITPFLGTLKDPVFARFSDLPCIVLPFYPYGDVYKYLRLYPDANKLDLLLQAGEGIRYLHQLKVVHGDIKANNILVNNQHRAMLTDFGIARVVNCRGFTTDSLHGNARWMAPELLAYNTRLFYDQSIDPIHPPPPPEHTTASDVWAFAMTIVEVYTGRVPFDTIYDSVISHVVVTKCKLPRKEDCPEVPELVWQILVGSGCWERLPENRATIDDMLVLLRSLSA